MAPKALQVPWRPAALVRHLLQRALEVPLVPEDQLLPLLPQVPLNLLPLLLHLLRRALEVPLGPEDQLHLLRQ